MKILPMVCVLTVAALAVPAPAQVAAAISGKVEDVTFQLAKVVAELIQTVGFGGKFEGGEHGLVNLFGRPATDGGATVQEYFHQANDPRLMDLDSGVTDGTDRHGHG